MSAPSFSQGTPNKIGNGIQVSGKNTLIKADADDSRAAIADEPIDAKIDGKTIFCVRVDNGGKEPRIVIGFTPMDTFDWYNEGFLGWNGFSGCGLHLCDGDLCYTVNKSHKIIDEKISEKAKEIIVILTISNNGKKKEIRFLCDGKESKTEDVSEHLKGNRLFPAICLL